MSSQPSSSRPGRYSSRPWRWLRAGIRVAGLAMSGAVGLMLAAWLTLHWGILPHIDDWRPQIEAQASRVLGQRLSIARIDAHSAGWVPAFELRDVRLFDRQGREALRLTKVSAALSPRSLLLLRPRFTQLLVDGLALDVRRDLQGRLHVAGFDVDAGAISDDSAAAEWLFEQHEWVLRGGSLRWTDELQNRPPLVLADVQLVMRNGLRRHELRLDATPPPAWGQRFSVRGRFTQPLLARRSDWQQWSGTVYAELPQADIAGLGRLVALPFELQAGRGALRAWLDIDRGRPLATTVDLALAEVSLRLAPRLEPLTLRQVSGRLEATREPTGVRLAATDFGFETDDGQSWPLGRLKLAWRQAQGAQSATNTAAAVIGGEFSADRLDLDLMARIAGRLPLGAALHGLLGDVAPQGVLNRLSGSWEGPPDAPQRYRLQSQVSGLTVAAARPGKHADGPARPGLQNADLDFSAHERGGEAVLSMNDGALEFPGVFAEPRLPLQRLSARLAWALRPAAGNLPGAAPAIELTVRNARFASADAEGELDAVWKSGSTAAAAQVDVPTGDTGASAAHPGHLDMTGKITRARADRVARHLPLALPASVREYVANAVTGGQVDSASFRVNGDLRDFPYTDGTTGEFRISARLRDVQFAYVPGDPPRGGSPGNASAWPALTQVAGELDFEGRSMRIRDARATLGNVQLRAITGQIKDFQSPLLQIEGLGRGPADEYLRFANGTPVAGWLGDSLRQASASGNADLKLALKLPLDDIAQIGVRGAITLAGSTLRLRPGTPLLEDTRGRVEFTQNGYTVAPGTARVFGGEASFEGGSVADGSHRFSARGTASAEGLRRAPEAAALAPLAARLRGQAGYNMQVTVRRGHPEITLTSNLVGLAIDLPAPLAKPAEASWPLRWQNMLNPEVAGAPPRDSLRFDLGNVLQARLERDLSGSVPRVERGGIGVFSEAPSPASGLAARLKLGTVDLDAWRAVVAAWPGTEGGDTLAPLDSIELGAERLLAGQRRLSKVALNLNRQTETGATTWRARVEADQVDGRIELRLPAGGGGGKVTARLARLSVPPAEAAGVQELLERAPASVPALDIVVEQLEWRGRQLGRVEVEAVNRASPARPGAREWQLARLNMTVPEATLRASGVWAPGSDGPGSTGRRMVLDFKLALADSGAFAERFGAGKALRRGKGELQGRVSWAGSPLALDFPSLNGQFSLALTEGQFPEADPGAARLLGMLNLQALPRRLLLDFRDLTQEGFGFDGVTGDFAVAGGVVSTSNLQVRGLQAAVLTEGRFDLLHETQDLRVLVVPEISAGTASLAYAAINPVVGLGAFITQWLLQRPLALAGTREYRVSGPWAEPKIERVERGAAAASAASAAASGAASTQ